MQIKLVNQHGKCFNQSLSPSFWTFHFGPLFMAYNKDKQFSLYYLYWNLLILWTGMASLLGHTDMTAITCVVAMAIFMIAFFCWHIYMTFHYNKMRTKTIIEDGFYPRDEIGVQALHHYGIETQTAASVYPDLPITFFIKGKSFFLALCSLGFYAALYLGHIFLYMYLLGISDQVSPVLHSFKHHV